jgi:hypothetical protein
MRLSPEDRLFTGSREDIINLIASVTGQQSNLPEPFGAEPIGDPAMDFLKGPSMASILLKNAKGMTLRNQMEEAQMAGMDPEAVARRRAQNDIEMSMGPMIASIKQLDR